MSLAIKICGLKTFEALDAALAEGADMIGLVFFPNSPRNVGLATGAALAARARANPGGKIPKVVVLVVDADDTRLAFIAATVKPDFLQLHGSETPERVAEIRARFGIPVLKAIGIAGPQDVARVPEYAGVADALLLDAKAPPGAAHPGGNGLAFDWNLIAALDLPGGFMLSGGLTPENLGEALRVTQAPGVDVSSGVESAPGVKDPARIVAFIQAARAASRDNAAEVATGAAPSGERPARESAVS